MYRYLKNNTIVNVQAKCDKLKKQMAATAS